MRRTIAITNQKGGVGKTTTAVNLGAYLADLGKKVLILDFDPQGNAGSGLGVNINNIESTIYEVLLNEATYAETVIETKVPNLSLIPSNIDLSGLEVDLRDNSEKDFQLKNFLAKIKNDYDFILIDCPPSLGVLTINALVASESVLIPLQCEYFALEGLTQLLRIINLVQKKLNTDLELEGILLTMFDSRTNLASQVVSDVRTHFSGQVFEVIIPRNVRLSEAPSFGEPIGIYDPDSSGALAYKKMARELIQKHSER
ncbi:MAG: AAA family ATPase [Spirochaetia bacterium]|nr:AAA family ATPase [Spirochaetia bacterium]